MILTNHQANARFHIGTNVSFLNILKYLVGLINYFSLFIYLNINNCVYCQTNCLYLFSIYGYNCRSYLLQFIVFKNNYNKIIILIVIIIICLYI